MTYCTGNPCAWGADTTSDAARGTSVASDNPNGPHVVRTRQRQRTFGGITRYWTEEYVCWGDADSGTCMWQSPYSGYNVAPVWGYTSPSGDVSVVAGFYSHYYYDPVYTHAEVHWHRHH